MRVALNLETLHTHFSHPHQKDTRLTWEMSVIIILRKLRKSEKQKEQKVLGSFQGGTESHRKFHLNRISRFEQQFWGIYRDISFPLNESEIFQLKLWLFNDLGQWQSFSQLHKGQYTGLCIVQKTHNTSTDSQSTNYVWQGHDTRHKICCQR